jgi:hypothetical protein
MSPATTLCERDAIGSKVRVGPIPLGERAPIHSRAERRGEHGEGHSVGWTCAGRLHSGRLWQLAVGVVVIVIDDAAALGRSNDVHHDRFAFDDDRPWFDDDLASFDDEHSAAVARHDFDYETIVIASQHVFHDISDDVGDNRLPGGPALPHVHAPRDSPRCERPAAMRALQQRVGVAAHVLYVTDEPSPAPLRELSTSARRTRWSIHSQRAIAIPKIGVRNCATDATGEPV